MADTEARCQKERAAPSSSAAAAAAAQAGTAARSVAAAARSVAAAAGGLECTDRCVCGAHVFAVRFHPSNPKLLAAAALNGLVEIHQLPEQQELQQHLQQQQQQRDKQKAICRQQRRKLRQQQQQQSQGRTSSSSSETSDEEAPERFLEADLECLSTLKQTLNPHNSSCRTLRFWEVVLSASGDGRCCVSDLSTKAIKWRSLKSKVGFEAIEVISATAFAAADEQGRVSLWDTRQQKPSKVFAPEMSGVAGMCCVSGCLLGAGAGHLCVWDLRKMKLKALSDSLDVDFTDLLPAKGGSKMCCSSDGGELCIFDWGDFGDYRDRITDIQTELNALAKFDEETLLAGCGDGCVRVVQLHPNRVAGIFAAHGKREGAVEALALNCDKSLLATAAHDERLRIHDATQVPTMLSKPSRRLKKTQQPQHDLRASRHFFDDL
ncbi:hypothetical protein Esti_006143 [Eimeria stiedai]